MSAAEDYREAWRRINQLVKEGRSWSGRERNCVFLNTRGTRFANISSVSGLDFPDDARGLAVADWDHDGDLDLWVTNRNAPRIRFLRNELHNRSHFLALRLIGNGTTVNRDAIGARVEVRVSRVEDQVSSDSETNSTLIRTLRAGEGYLGQSSKWVHFGLGRSDEIEHVSVRWPDGSEDRLTDLEVDTHYRIVQGTLKAVPWNRPGGESQIAPSEPSLAKSNGVSRTLLTWRIPLPRLRYETHDGSVVELDTGKPTFLNLWSRTCRPCVVELSKMTESQEKLRQEGLEILALSVDGLEHDSGGDSAESEALLRKINFPFVSAQATAELVEKLQMIQDTLFLRSQPLPLPTSVLLDSRGRLAAIYRGPVSMEVLIDDVKRLPLEGDALRQAALPFTDHWHRAPTPTGLAPAVLRPLVDGGYLDDAIQYVADHRNRLEQEAGFSNALVALADRLRLRGDSELAVDQIREAIRLNPNLPRARMNLAGMLLEQGQVRQAEAELRAAAGQDPDDPSIRMNLGLVLAAQRRWKDAAAQFQQTVRLDPANIDAHLGLGSLYLKQNQPDEAARHYREVVRLDPKHAKARLRLGELLLRGNQVDQASRLLHELVRDHPDFAGAHFLLAAILNQQEQEATAAKHYHEVLRIDAKNVATLNNLAYLLATANDPSVVNPVEAVLHAKNAARHTKHRVASVLDTLAVAYAANGQFQAAIQAANEAFKLASTSKDVAGVKSIKAHLKLFKDGKKVRD